MRTALVSFAKYYAINYQTTIKFEDIESGDSRPRKPKDEKAKRACMSRRQSPPKPRRPTRARARSTPAPASDARARRLAQAMAHHRAGRIAEAEAGYRSLLAERPDDPEAQHLLGVSLHQQGRSAEAVDLIRRALAARPNLAEAHTNLGAALQALKRYDEAIDSYRRALALKPDNAKTHNNLGAALKSKGDALAAIEAYRQAIALDPTYAVAQNNLGAALINLGRLAEAAEVLGAALKRHPDHAETWNNYGTALKNRGRFSEAIEAYHKAIAVKPDFSEAYNNLGAALQAIGRQNEAADAYRKAIRHKPDAAEAHNNLANTLRAVSRIDEAEIEYRRAIELKPGLAEAYGNLATVLCDQSRIEDAIDAYHKALELKPDFIEARSNYVFTLHYHPDSTPDQIRTEAEVYDRLISPRMAGYRRRHENDAKPDRRLRVGFVSPDFWRHSCAYFMEMLFEHLDRNEIEIVAYANVRRPDAVTQRLRQRVDLWRDTLGVPDEEVLTQIREDRIDILIDVAGHTADNRLALFAASPAPVQASWLGYPGTTGLSTMGYRLTDAIADPPGVSDPHYTERLVRLPDGFLCYRPLVNAPSPAPAPSTTGRPVTFGSFNNLPKVNDRVVALWAEILNRVPNSRLLLKARALGGATARDRIVAGFRQHGIAPDRLELIGWTVKLDDHLSLYGNVDVALDQFPYNGTTTTCEAIWMGVPVVTLLGDRHAGRVGVTLLARLGLKILVAPTPAEYVAKAVALAADVATRSRLRTELRARMIASTLCDGPRFARAMTAAWRGLWREWCASQDK